MKYKFDVGMAMGTYWTGYYSAHPHTRVHTLVDNKFGVRLHILWVSKYPYPHPLPALSQQKDNK